MSKTIECKSDEGVIVGLIDSLMSISRVLVEKLEHGGISEEVKEALLDLKSDVSFNDIVKLAARMNNSSEEIIKHFVNLKYFKAVAHAQELSMTHTIVELDGVPTNAIMDNDNNRLNFYVKDGTVYKCTIG